MAPSDADFPAAAPIADQARFLVRYAVLAPSARNSQPWRFEVDGGHVCLYADLARRPRTADRQARDLYLSLGCALENLLVAAARFGLRADVDYFPMSEEDELVAQVWLNADAAPAAQPDPLFGAIGKRRTGNAIVDGPPLTAHALNQLRGCAHAGELALLLTQDPAVRRMVEGMLTRAGAAAHGQPSYLEELAACPGQRERAAFTGVPAFGLISAATPARLNQVKAGQHLERLALKAATLGLALQPLSALLEFPEVTAAFTKLFGIGGVPLVPFRIGAAGVQAALSPRRPLDEVLK